MHDIQKEATKELAKEMLYKVAYTPTVREYNAALQELTSYKSELATWVEDNEPEQRAESKFRNERRGRLNNSVFESWSNWMQCLRPMSVPWLVSDHLEKLGKKLYKHKQDTKK